MPTASVICSQNVLDQLAELNMKALQVQKGKVQTVALQAVHRRQRGARIQMLKKKLAKIVEIDISGDSPPKNKPSQTDDRADNATQQPPKKNTDKPAEYTHIDTGDKKPEDKSKDKPQQKSVKKSQEKEEHKPQPKAEHKPVKQDQEQKPVKKEETKKELILKIERLQPKKEIVTKPVPESKMSLKLQETNVTKAVTTKPKILEKTKPVRPVEEAKDKGNYLFLISLNYFNPKFIYE